MFIVDDLLETRSQYTWTGLPRQNHLAPAAHILHFNAASACPMPASWVWKITLLSLCRRLSNITSRAAT
jgi:hypothetical protein